MIRGTSAVQFPISSSFLQAAGEQQQQAASSSSKQQQQAANSTSSQSLERLSHDGAGLETHPMPPQANQAPAEMPPLSGSHVRWAMVGTGSFAVDWIAPALQRAPGCKLVAVVSRSIHRARETAALLGAPLAYASIDDIDVAEVRCAVPRLFNCST